MNWRSKHYWIAVFLVFVTLIYSNSIRSRIAQDQHKLDLSLFPAEIDDWESTDFYYDKNVLDDLKTDQTLARRYFNENGQEVWLFLGYWTDQKYGAQPHSPLHCLPGSGWNILSNQDLTFESSFGLITANYAEISNGDSRQTMLFWYQTREGSLTSGLDLKMSLVKNNLLRKPTDVVFVRLSASCEDETPSSNSAKLLAEFWKKLAPSFEAAFTTAN